MFRTGCFLDPCKDARIEPGAGTVSVVSTLSDKAKRFEAD
jgi:hypothetical protein